MEFLKASIADLVTLFFSSLQNSEGSGNGDSGDSFADPCQFLPLYTIIYHLYQNLSITAIAGGFLAAAETLLQCYE